MRTDAVFEGGGVKGIALAGAISVAEELGYAWENLAGTSAGAITASLLAAGYKANELKEIMETIDYTRFMDQGLIDRIPAIGKLISLVFEKGIYEGSYLRDWLSEKLAAKGKRTFGDLQTQYPEAQYKYKLRVIASDITKGRMLVLPQDIADYGMEPDDLVIADAVRMSMSIPYFYKPFRLGRSFVVDGGILSNFPVWLFDSKGIPDWPTLGFKLVSKQEKLPEKHKIVGPITLLKAMFLTMMEAHDARYEAEANAARTICIDTLDVGTTQFNLSKDKANALYESGQKAAMDFFQTWDFERYVKQYRMQSAKV